MTTNTRTKDVEAGINQVVEDALAEVEGAFEELRAAADDAHRALDSLPVRAHCDGCHGAIEVPASVTGAIEAARQECEQALRRAREAFTE